MDAVEGGGLGGGDGQRDSRVRRRLDSVRSAQTRAHRCQNPLLHSCLSGRGLVTIVLEDAGGGASGTLILQVGRSLFRIG